MDFNIKLFLLLHSDINCGKSVIQSINLSPRVDLLLHYLAKFECFTVQLYRKVNLFYLKARKIVYFHVSPIYLCRLIYNITTYYVKNVCHHRARML